MTLVFDSALLNKLQKK